ncbi:class I SAM-dependent methyltransferase [Phormidium sp. LEGE 05292]|uniref:class I SAM-dependent methyltransferase n=1 Tax=[Phormidium] sp. LEGE 05292 TaxID=767427 RepID=UPI00187FECBB|nr:class I SAM-dependent methyltransferase [Phormidium sp. LEGE 05292]MBE9224527.1 class I SAM-dependent methyltransferase [Phormidium sp. LEGE 05292]
MSSENRYTDYDPWAWLYNESEAHLACRRFMPSLKKLLLPHLPKGAEILDLCCGTGQLTQQLLSGGYRVIGLDGSEKMLHYARENAPNCQFILGDARSFEFPSTFDAVICTDSALNHIMSLEELKSVFRNVYNVLKEDGLFFFDLGLGKRYSNIPVNDGELKNEYAWTVGETYNSEEKTGTFTITIFQPSPEKTNENLPKPSFDLPAIKRSIYNNFLRFVKPATLLQLVDKNWHSSKITFSVKPYSKAEVEAALKEVGFTSVKVYNFRCKSAASKEDKYAYFVAEKLHNELSFLESRPELIGVNNKI